MNKSINEDCMTFWRELENYLNDDQELKRRLKPFRTFCGGPCPYPGPGPYPPPNLAFDPTGWSRARGYPSSILIGRDLIQVDVEGRSVYTISLSEEGVFKVEMRPAKNPILEVALPIFLFKELVLGKHRVIWALSDPKVRVRHSNGISLSDWVTVLEIFACMQELVERRPDLWRIVEEDKL
ncbi:MAG: hypothetical protein QFX33_00065 [Candidatus Nezhaarchaeota archaeon]|nr:hypothetical protein [Candidatus Nezhaarchaeota archaeon]